MDRQRREHHRLSYPEFPGQLGTPSRVSLRTSLLLWFLGIALVPLAVISLVSYQKAYDSRLEDVHGRLIAAAEDRLTLLDEYFTGQFNSLDQQAHTAEHGRFLSRLEADLAAADQESAQWVGSRRWLHLARDEDVELRNVLSHGEFQDILLVDGRDRVLYGEVGGPELGRDLGDPAYRNSALAETVRKARRDHRAAFSGFGAALRSDRLPVAYLAQELEHAADEMPGVLVYRIGVEDLPPISRSDGALGAGGRSYLLSEDLVLLTCDQRGGWSDAVGDRIVTELTLDWMQRHSLSAEFPLIRMAERNGQGELVSRYRDPGNDPVLGIRRTLEVRGVPLGLFTEVSEEETLAGVRAMRIGMTLLLCLVSLIVTLAALMVSHRIAEPISSLGRMMQRVADGHRVIEMPVSGPNEVGRLARQFGVMLAALNEAQLANDHQYRLQKSQFELQEKMRGEPDLNTLAESVLEYIGGYYSAEVGAFYLARPGGRLVLTARVGLSEDAAVEHELRIGQGIVGKVAREGRSCIMDRLPPNHLRVRTATGESNPSSVIIAPFLIDGQVKGVLELGTYGEFVDEDLEFLRLSGESVAMALDSARSRERVHRLLEETRRQAGVLSRQQKELQLTNAQLARSDQYKNEFLANMSHELRTPLNSMLIMSQVLSENQNGNLTEEEVVAAGTINKAGTGLLAIIDDILDLSRVEAGKLEIDCEDVDSAALLQGLEALFQPMADKLGLAFTVEAAPDLPEFFRSDQGRVSQILNNLLGNALKFTEAGSVTLRAYRPDEGELGGILADAPGSWIAFSVTDTGIGMTGEKMAEVFEAFNQGDGSIGRRFGGSGLGLSISRKLADLLGGQVRMESSEGRGSTFTLYLPLEPAPEMATPDLAAGVHPMQSILAPPVCSTRERPRPAVVDSPPAQPKPDSAIEEEKQSLLGRRILIADRDMRNAFGLCAELERLGATVRLARKWSDVENETGKDPDLMLLDAAAFDLEPDDVRRLIGIRSEAARERIVFMAEDGGGAGQTHCLAKPVDSGDLIGVVLRRLASVTEVVEG